MIHTYSIENNKIIYTFLVYLYRVVKNLNILSKCLRCKKYKYIK